MKSAIFKDRLACECIAFMAGLLFFCSVSAPGQPTKPAYFGCSGRTDFFEKPGVPFAPLTGAARIGRWRTRPSVTFDVFNEKQYEFSKIIFYCRRISIQPRSQDADPADQAENSDATSAN